MLSLGIHAVPRNSMEWAIFTKHHQKLSSAVLCDQILFVLINCKSKHCMTCSAFMIHQIYIMNNFNIMSPYEKSNDTEPFFKLKNTFDFGTQSCNSISWRPP